MNVDSNIIVNRIQDAATAKSCVEHESGAGTLNRTATAIRNTVHWLLTSKLLHLVQGRGD